MFVILLAMRSGWFAEGRFFGKVLDEWIGDTQEFIHLKLPLSSSPPLLHSYFTASFQPR